MRKFLLLLVLAAAAAFGVWFGMHGGGSRTSSAAVTALLPKETLAFLHLPDVNGARARWHETETYKLWREPAVQDFLQRPLSRTPKYGSARQRLDQISSLEIKDAFFAITSWEQQQLRLVGGFRFKGTPEDVEKLIVRWRDEFGSVQPSPKRETIEYEKHQIEVTTADTVTLATTYNGNWFFVANDLATLKTLLDRADRRVKDAGTTLASDEEFIATSKHMAANYVARVYGRLDRYFSSIAGAQTGEGAANEQLSLLRQLRSFSATTSFDKGKIRDVIFVGMPRLAESAELSRSSLALATRDSFFYLASFFRLPERLPQPSASSRTLFPAMAQRIFASLAAIGVTREEWQRTFSSELGVIGEWPENSRTPTLFATIEVKDAGNASQLLARLTAASDETVWVKSEKDGVEYYSQPPISPMLPVSPTLGLSRERLVLGQDAGAVEAFLKRGAVAGAALTATDVFKIAERSVPTATNAFAYLDTSLFYTRLDAAIRPMLVMAAAFLPSLAQTVEAGKLPPPEVITKHLSPMTLSQRYQDNGYLAEAIGPLPFCGVAVGLVVGSGAGASLYHRKLPPTGGPMPPVRSAPPTLGTSPTSTPEQSPEE